MENQDTPSLGIQDIQNALRIIDFAAEQGAFKGWSTIDQVKAVRTRLDDFVTFATKQQEEAAAAEAASAEAATTDTPAAEVSSEVVAPAATAEAVA